MIGQELRTWIEQAAAVAGFPAVRFTLEHPSELSHGDYACNAALILARQLNKNPKEVVETLLKSLEGGKPTSVSGISVAGPGFINITLTRDFFAKSIEAAAQKEWGSTKDLQGKKIMVEYTQPNPFKPFHIGHLMSNAIGESLARLLEWSGATITRANYQGDIGLHIAKALWGVQRFDASVDDPEEIGRAYTAGNEAYESDEGAKQEIVAINRALYEKSDPALNELYERGRRASLDHFEAIYRKLGTTFDQYYFESETADRGKRLVEERTGSVFERSDGAVVYRGEKHGLHTRVFVTSEGFPTYEGKEIGLAELKARRAPDHDLYISVTASEQTDVFRVTRAAITEVLPEIGEKIRHVAHGMMRFASGKMSSRKGNVVTGESLIADVEKLVGERMKAKPGEPAAQAKGSRESRAEDATLATAVAVGAIKYSILKQSAGKDIIFDPEKAISLEGDSGPYLMYAHARACSVLEKAHKEKVVGSVASAPAEPYVLERLLYRFPEVVERAAREYEPHYVTTFLTELAGAFNSFYATERIADAKENAAYKVALTAAVRNTLQKGLWLLGIVAPERM